MQREGKGQWRPNVGLPFLQVCTSRASALPTLDFLTYTGRETAYYEKPSAANVLSLLWGYFPSHATITFARSTTAMRAAELSTPARCRPGSARRDACRGRSSGYGRQQYGSPTMVPDMGHHVPARDGSAKAAVAILRRHRVR